MVDVQDPGLTVGGRLNFQRPQPIQVVAPDLINVGLGRGYREFGR